MQVRSSKGPIPVKQLVREVKNASDTPSLISVLAGDRVLLHIVLRIMNPTPGVDAHILEELDQACRQENITVRDLKLRLQPAASALGISPKNEDHAPGFYEILKVPSNAPDSSIRSAYRTRARELHPDTNPGADSVDFVKLAEAYRVLSNPELRHRYDAGRQKTPYWVEQDHTTRKSADLKKSFMRRHRRLTLYQFVGAAVFLLAAIVFADYFFKEQALMEPPRVAKTTTPEDPPIQEAPPEESPATVLQSAETISPPEEPKPEPSPPPPRKTEKVAAARADAREAEEPAVEIPVVQEEILQPAHREDPPIQEAPPEESPATVLQSAEAISPPEEPKPEPSPPPPRKTEKVVAAGPPLEQIEQFLASYCGAYQQLNYDLFMGYFTEDAMENDQAVKDLEPQYRRNFNNLRDLSYDIHVNQYFVRHDRIEVSGDYVLRWRFKNSRWKKRKGNIFLSLVQVDDDYRVSRLVYH